MATSAIDAPRHPLRFLVDDWLGKIKIATEHRDERFGKYAQEAMNLFDGENNWMWNDAQAKGPQGFLAKDGIMPTFKISVNKLFEAVALFGPALYSQNPNCTVTARQYPEVPPEALGFAPEDPVYQQLFVEDQYLKAQKVACAEVKQSYLNWLQYETDKKTQSRRAITEAIVAGLGILEIGMYRPPFSNITYPKATYRSWKDVVVDPDADYWEDVNWIAIRRREARNKVEEKFGLMPGDLKGHHQSAASQGTDRARREANAGRNGQSFDIVEYWEIYSKNGMGDKLAGSRSEENAEYDFTAMGDYCYLAVANGVPFPLNLPSNYLLEATDPEELAAKAQWPIPFWSDASAEGGWPIVRLSFYESPRSVWPISLFKPAMGEIRFVNWCLSFLADKVAQSCTTYVGVAKAAGVDIQKQLSGIATPFTVLEISQVTGKTLKEAVEFLQSPDFPQHVWTMVAQVMDLIDKRTGLTELIYGLSGRQMRSAAEANIKDSNIAVRPDDMAQSVENALSLVNVREMQAARWFCEPQDIEPAVGRMGAIVWEQLVQQQDVDAVTRDFAYRIEAGSARKPNKANKIAQLTDIGQVIIAYAQQTAQMGQFQPWNAYVTDMMKAMDLDPAPYLIPPPPPPGEAGPSPEEMAMQAELQAKQVELQFKQFEREQEIVHTEEKHDQAMRHEEEKHGQEMKFSAQESKADIQAAKAKAAATPKPAPKPKAGARK